VPLTNYDTA